MENKKSMLSLALVFLLSFLQVMTPISYVFADGMDNENIETVEEINESNNLGKEDNQEIENEVNLDVDLDNNDNSNLEIELDNNLEDEDSSKNELENNYDSNIVDKLQDPTFELNNEENYFYETQESFMMRNNYYGQSAYIENIENLNLSDKIFAGLEVKKGDNVYEVEYIFDSSGYHNKIKSGDFIEIELNNDNSTPIELGIFANGALDVKDEKGNIIGVLNYKDNIAKVIFNKDVEKYDVGTIKGGFKFKFEANNKSTESDANISVSSGSTVKYITVEKVPESGIGGQYPVIFKNGRVFREKAKEIFWDINIHGVGRSFDAPLIIEDEIQNTDSGQKLLTNRITIEINHKDGYTKRFNSFDEFNDFLRENSGGHASLIDNKKIEVMINENLLSSYNIRIMYYTEIQDESLVGFENKISYSYKELEKDAVKDEKIIFQENMLTSAWASGALSRELKIFKTIGETENTLEGAKFKLEKLNKEDIFVEDKNLGKSIDLVTDKNGMASIKNLPEGDYIVTEVEAPNGFEIDSENNSQEFTIEFSKDGYDAKFKNNVKNDYNIRVNKIWENNNITKDNVKVVLYRSVNNSNPIKVDDKELDLNKKNNWEGSFENLPKVSDEGKEYILNCRSYKR